MLCSKLREIHTGLRPRGIDFFWQTFLLKRLPLPFIDRRLCKGLLASFEARGSKLCIQTVILKDVLQAPVPQARELPLTSRAEVHCKYRSLRMLPSSLCQCTEKAASIADAHFVSCTHQSTWNTRLNVQYDTQLNDCLVSLTCYWWLTQPHSLRRGSREAELLKFPHAAATLCKQLPTSFLFVVLEQAWLD